MKEIKKCKTLQDICNSVAFWNKDKNRWVAGSKILSKKEIMLLEMQTKREAGKK